MLDGLRSCGKSIVLAMLVNWARSEGWLVFYAPRGQDWTRGGVFYKNHETSLWDTPVQAANILRVSYMHNLIALCLSSCKMSVQKTVFFCGSLFFLYIF